MKEILYDEIPSLDLADFTGNDKAKKDKFVAALGAAYNNIGFVAIRNHFLSDDLQKRLYDAIKKLFALPDPVKQKYERMELAGQRVQPVGLAPREPAAQLVGVQLVGMAGVAG